jgi:hypothetical protein
MKGMGVAVVQLDVPSAESGFTRHADDVVSRHFSPRFAQPLTGRIGRAFQVAARSRQPVGHDQPAGVRTPRMRDVVRLSATRPAVARPRAVTAVSPAPRGQMHRALVRDFSVDVVLVKGHGWSPLPPQAQSG